MAETLLAILLVTSSATGPTLVHKYPANPVPSPRLSRYRPEKAEVLPISNLDNPWRTSHAFEPSVHEPRSTAATNGAEYTWRKPASAIRVRSASMSTRNAAGTSATPPKSAHLAASPTKDDQYDRVLGYNPEFLTSLLCPHASMFHQKFELIVDELAFIGHPVCAYPDGTWKFKPETGKPYARGRGSRNRQVSQEDADPSEAHPTEHLGTKSAWLQSFHLVLVLDLPDPSSCNSGNVWKYFDIIYERIAFNITAVLFREQVISNFVELECERLTSLREACIGKGQPFSDYMSQALAQTSIAPAMQVLFDSIKTSTIAYITIHDLPMELQLPPYLDTLLHVAGDDDIDELQEQDAADMWGPHMSFGWRLETLAPWKSILLLEKDGFDPFASLRGPHVSVNDRPLVDGLIRFLEVASITLSLADMSSLLDWDLDTQVYPVVRWLVEHRRAKIVDVVHPGLKTVFTLPPRFEQPLKELTADFDKEFTDPVASLPEILSLISTAPSKQSDNHFYATVVQHRDLIPVYHDVVLWMLKRGLLIRLSLRIRIVATREIKERAKFRKHQRVKPNLDVEKPNPALHRPPALPWLSLSPKAAHSYSFPGRMRSSESHVSALVIREDDGEKLADDDDDVFEENAEGAASEEDDDGGAASIITDPSQATPLQQLWLATMSEGKNEHIAHRFAHINQYFDGKMTDDEILYRAEITRKQLREVLHVYEEYLQTFLHP
ncbi:nitrogen permease regulator of amino acid transport activity 3-domain-containing protein [Schizophyllum amplum]|uniref:Nitrogen permease regulator 3 n=1 Tax=Schizophyllum amplum TaxID=97359 RepID=A0A550D098_9AGAR|nr:nitrogen permease regulator of amino acid transport activity 3-domain-containing protein [Auriculariopsis ampla]